jgi:hypothetical protein
MRPGAGPKLIAHHLRAARYEVFGGEGSMTQERLARQGLATVAAAAAGVVLLLLAPSAPAGHGVPPETVLHAAGRDQRGGLVWEDWTSRSGDACVQSSGDGTGAYPKRIRLTPGHHRARFVLMRRQRPAAVKLTAWHSLDSQGQQTGPSEVLPRKLESRRSASGRVTAWVARFRVHVPPSYFIRLYVRWPDGKCGGPRHVLRTYALRAAG